MPILVDTSVWIDFFAGKSTPEVSRLKRFVGHEDLVIGDLILAELLQGVRSAQEAALIDMSFRAYHVVCLVGERVARRSAANYRSLRRQGITVGTTIDCLIATWCIDNRTPLLHNDRDFRPFAKLGLIEA